MNPEQDDRVVAFERGDRKLEPLPNTSVRIFRTPGDDFVHMNVEGPLHEISVLALILGELGLIPEDEIRV